MDDTDISDPDKLAAPSDRAVRALDHAFVEEETETSEPSITESTPPESSDTRYIDRGEREFVRVLMISTDKSVFLKESPGQVRAQTSGLVFEELHIIVLTDRTDDFKPLRLAENVWAYPTNSRKPFFYAYDAYVIAKRQLSFADGFRVDAIAAENPFAAGLAGYALSRRFNRAFQIEVRVDPFAMSFIEAHPHNKWLALLAGFLIPRATHIRVLSDTLKGILERRYPKRAEIIETLPVFSDVSTWRDTLPTFDLHVEYPLLKFIILMATPLTKDSGVEEGIDVCAPILMQYPTVGLVIVGDGLMRATLEKKVAELNIQNQIVWRGNHADLLSHVKTANVFLNTSPIERYDDTLAQVAAGGLPIISTDVGFAHDVIVDGQNGFLCPVGDSVCLSMKIEEFLSHNQLRMVFGKAAQDKVLRIVAANIEGYFEALQGSIERCVIRHGAASEEPTAPPVSS